MIINFKLHLFIDFFQCNRKAVTVEHRKINIGIIHTDGTAHRTRNGHRIQKVIDFFFQLLPDKSFLFIQEMAVISQGSTSESALQAAKELYELAKKETGNN